MDTKRDSKENGRWLGDKSLFFVTFPIGKGTSIGASTIRPIFSIPFYTLSDKCFCRLESFLSIARGSYPKVGCSPIGNRSSYPVETSGVGRFIQWWTVFVMFSQESVRNPTDNFLCGVFYCSQPTPTSLQP